MASAKKKPTKKAHKTVVKKPAAKKKVAKKVTPKKTAAKKRVTKTTPKKATKKTSMKNAPASKCFWVNNGQVLKNLKDLHGALLIMKKEQYVYHTQNGANHFAMWVDIVLQEPDCAKALNKVKSQKTAAKKVEEAIAKYKTVAKKKK